MEARIRSSQHHGGSVADAPLDDVHAQDFIEDDIIRHVVMSLHSPVVLLLALIEVQCVERWLSCVQLTVSIQVWEL